MKSFPKLKAAMLAVLTFLLEPIYKLYMHGCPRFGIQPMAMYVIFQSDYARGNKILPGLRGSESASIRIEFPQVVALLTGDTIDMCPLPEDACIGDVYLDSDRLDTNGTPLITLSVGILNQARLDIDVPESGGAAWIAASTLAQTATNVVARATTAHALRMQPMASLLSNRRRSIGIRCVAQAATGVVSLTNLLVNRGLWQPNTGYNVSDFITLPSGVRYRCTTAGVSGLFRPQFHSLFNNTTADGTAVWTTADPVIGLTLEFRSASFGS